MSDNEQKPVLVLGATGRTGRRVLERLTSLGRPVRAGSRSATPPFDWADPATWPAVLSGVGAVYVSYQPDLAVPGAAEAVGEIAAAAGRDVAFSSISPEQYRAAMAEHGVPPEVVSMVEHLFAEVLDGRNAHLSDGVRRALGREPRDFADYARRTAPTGVWNPLT
ncbi:hypothetical protein ABT337_17680 [Saccharopolyspora hirsuta]|uniref:NmrA family transcriptional regulator n=1 Tax=Saccharopolyspora hirsuta TaxID=1837 RepID=A0A5M7BDX8_SACHI|nr:hypothetical protein [Saccharopolyspora hirsuta]KAA5826558.1 hypothetical protein F1721_31220 [Saccharopolyspora hirsuta]